MHRKVLMVDCIFRDGDLRGKDVELENGRMAPLSIVVTIESHSHTDQCRERPDHGPAHAPRT